MCYGCDSFCDPNESISDCNYVANPYSEDDLGKEYVSCLEYYYYDSDKLKCVNCEINCKVCKYYRGSVYKKI